MKVLHFLDTLGRGGAEVQALDVARNAKDYGLDLTVVAAGGGGLEEAFRSTGTDVILLKRRLPVDPLLALDLRKIIKARKIEIVHGYQPVDGIHLYLATLGMPHMRKVLSFQGFIQDSKNRRTASFLIPRMDANIVVSRGLEHWLCETDGLDTSKNFSVIYNGADPKRMIPTGGSIRRELGLDAHTPLIGMIANFYRDRRKDHLSVVKAMIAVNKRILDAHCVFVGGVEPGAEHKKAACVQMCSAENLADRVHFIGSRGDIPDILSELDIAVQSSFHEGLPVAISEAMLAGTAMVLSDIEPHLEASRDGEYALVFPTGDAAALADRIIVLLENDERRRSLAAAAKEFATENLSIYSHLRDLKALMITSSVADDKLKFVL